MKKSLAPGRKILIPLLIVALVLFVVWLSKDRAEQPSNDLPITTTPLAQPSTFTFESETLSFEYGTEWRISGKTDNSIVLTHKDRPGDMLLSAQWFTSQMLDTTDVTQLYRSQLGLLATEIQRLEDIKIGSINAERYASLISRGDERSVVTLHVLFNSGNTFYLVTFNANPDDFVAYAASANQVIDTIRVP